MQIFTAFLHKQQCKHTVGIGNWNSNFNFLIQKIIQHPNLNPDSLRIRFYMKYNSLKYNRTNVQIYAIISLKSIFDMTTVKSENFLTFAHYPDFLCIVAVIAAFIAIYFWRSLLFCSKLLNTHTLHAPIAIRVYFFFSFYLYSL